MVDLIVAEGIVGVIDATHPYAAEVTRNVREACERTGTPLIRVLRSATSVEEGVVARVADDVVVLEEGAVVEDRPVGEIFSSPRHPVTVALVEAHRALCARLGLLQEGGDER